MKKSIAILLFSFFWVISSAQQNKNDNFYLFDKHAEILYVPGLNVDSIDKCSLVPRLLFVPEKNICEFNMLWGGQSFYLLTITTMPDKIVDQFKKQNGEKRKAIEEKRVK